jgi:PHD/YefM family antitoxin component YafN of YafNO toxin-antitoxin module
MTTIALESLSEALRKQVLKAIEEPVLVTDEGKPILVVRSLLEDEVADELIVQNPAFQATVERARQQKAAGKVKTLAELRAKYKVE